MRITLHYLFILPSTSSSHPAIVPRHCSMQVYATCSSSGVYRPKLRLIRAHRRSCGRGAAATAYATRRTRIVPSPLRRRMRTSSNAPHTQLGEGRRALPSHRPCGAIPIRGSFSLASPPHCTRSVHSRSLVQGVEKKQHQRCQGAIRRWKKTAPS
ncbi:hypothetical protein BD626DRAFT_527583 [Schizophyllum amplum]|uniref:Uncharacterized protein n=1 Tax=Schizophyllum amplum TaxID=97359 RepID=A0A550BS95_9AGAR|nr:hypothetical protein BD626DRAFT_527583 [Auriculariopsis ampla]